MLAGLLEPTGGRDPDQRIGYTQILARDTVADRLYARLFSVYTKICWSGNTWISSLVAINFPLNGATKSINELLELVDLTEKHDAYVNTLSRGMRQRLCLAHALIHDPQVLLLDEPASGSGSSRPGRDARAAA